MTTHINPETGEHGKCTATIKDCPYQKKGDKLGITTHFNSVKEAIDAGEKVKETLYGQFASVKPVKKLDEKAAAAELRALIKEKDGNLTEVATDSNILPEVLDVFVKRYVIKGDKFHKGNLVEVLKNPKLSTETLRVLASKQHAYPWERENIINHQNCPADLKKEHAELTKLRTIARDKNATPEQLAEIMEMDKKKSFPFATEHGWSEIESITKDAAMNGNLEYKYVKRFLNDPDAWFAYRVSDNHKLKSQKDFDDLYKDFNFLKDDEQAPDYLKQSIFSQRRNVMNMLSKSEYATPEQLQEIANIAVEDARKADDGKWVSIRPLANVAENPNTSPILLKKLASSRYADVKKAVAKNSSTPEAALLKLANVKNSQVQQAFADNQQLPVKVQLALINNPDFPMRYQKILVQKNKNLDPEVLDILANSRLKEVRDLVRKHPKTSMKTLLKLSERDNEE